MSNTPIIPEKGTLCDIQHCDRNATRSWYTEVTDQQGLPVRSTLINYCPRHEPSENTMGAGNTTDDRIKHVEYAIQKKVGNGEWEFTAHDTIDDEQKAINLLRAVENNRYTALENAFYNIQTPKEARAAADRHEQLQQTDFRIIRRVIVDERIIGG